MIFILLVSQTKLPVRNFSSKNLRGYPKNDVDSWERGKKLVKIADVVYGRPLGSDRAGRRSKNLEGKE